MIYGTDCFARSLLTGRRIKCKGNLSSGYRKTPDRKNQGVKIGQQFAGGIHVTNLTIFLDGAKSFQLLIDIKTEPYSTLKRLEEILVPYQDFLNGTKGIKVEIVVPGNRPTITDYRNYPDVIRFDYQSITDTTGLPLDKIALISLNFRNLSLWNGKRWIIDREREVLKNAIAVAHALQKPIRFWATPDSKTSWKALKELGVEDYINTDQPFEVKAYFKTPWK